jgi:hypothetical protein
MLRRERGWVFEKHHDELWTKLGDSTVEYVILSSLS